MKTKISIIFRSVWTCGLFGLFVSLAGAAELPLRLQYPTQTNDVILTSVENGSLVFRPQGRDIGGRAYLELDELSRSRVILNFLFPKDYYEAIKQLEAGHAAQALPVMRREVAPFLDYMALSGLPGNMLPTVIAYIDVLSEAGEWQDAVNVATRIPISVAPSLALERIAELSYHLYENQQTAALDRVHQSILASRDLAEDRIEVLMQMGDYWREVGEYQKAFELYRKVQIKEGPYQVRARLWVAYCSFYLGHQIVPKVFLEVLPDMEATAPGYSLRQLIKAHMRINEGDYAGAMRLAAEGKIYANAADSWYPELLHTVAVLYGDLGLVEAASTAHREVSILFPSSTWGAKSLQILKQNQI